MANTSHDKYVKELCLNLIDEGLSAPQVRKKVYDMGYITPCVATIKKWYKDKKGAKRPHLREYHKGNPFFFQPSPLVADWIAAQSDKSRAVNTILEWYLKQLKLEEKREKARERYQQRKMNKNKD